MIKDSVLYLEREELAIIGMVKNTVVSINTHIKKKELIVILANTLQIIRNKKRLTNKNWYKILYIIQHQ